MKRFTRWATGRAAPRGKLQIVEQRRPGEEARREDEAAGIPDAWLYNEDRWALLLESKITARLRTSQLQRHLATAARWGFPNAELLTITAGDQTPRVKDRVINLTWTGIYGWLLQEKRRSEWAARCADYMEILESDLIEDRKLKEGAVTTFSGIPFDSKNPYSYLEAKRLLKLAMDNLRESRKLKRELRMDPNAGGRGAITGRAGVAVWDFLPLKHAHGAKAFTQYPHLTVAIESDRLLATVTIPNSVRATLRQRLRYLGADGFGSLVSEVNARLKEALRGDRGAEPRIIVVQRRYLTQRSPAIYDATLDFDMRTAFEGNSKRGRSNVRAQPQWLSATFDALSRKRSNLQIGIGASFPYSRSSSVHGREIINRVIAAWIACKPILTAMGLR
jgi:hypothetical protein